MLIFLLMFALLLFLFFKFHYWFIISFLSNTNKESNIDANTNSLRLMQDTHTNSGCYIKCVRKDIKDVRKEMYISFYFYYIFFPSFSLSVSFSPSLSLFLSLSNIVFINFPQSTFNINFSLNTDKEISCLIILKTSLIDDFNF